MILRLLCTATLFVIAFNASCQNLPAAKKDKLVIQKVEITHYKKVVDGRKAADFPKYEKACPSWNLTKEQITQVIKDGRFIDGHEFHYYFNVLPCSYEGEVIINGTLKYEFEVNAGSYAIVYKKGVTLFMAYDKSDIPFITRRAGPEE